MPVAKRNNVQDRATSVVAEKKGLTKKVAAKGANSQDLECPVEFLWGTFCRDVLADGGNRSLKDVILSLNTDVSQGKLPADHKGKSEINVAFGPMALYAVLQRRPGVDGEISVPITVDVTMPGSQPVTTTVKFDNTHTRYQLTSVIANALVKIPLKKGTHEVTYRASWSCRGTVLGRTEVPVKVEVKG